MSLISSHYLNFTSIFTAILLPILCFVINTVIIHFKFCCIQYTTHGKTNYSELICFWIRILRSRNHAIWYNYSAGLVIGPPAHSANPVIGPSKELHHHDVSVITRELREAIGGFKWQACDFGDTNMNESIFLWIKISRDIYNYGATASGGPMTGSEL